MVINYKNLNNKMKRKFRKFYKEMYNAIDFSYDYLIESIEDDVETVSIILVYVLKNKIVGCIYIHEYDYFSDVYFPNGCYYLSNLYIQKKYRRIGLASKLLDEVENIAKKNNIDTILSDYIENNEESKFWHNKNGFKTLNKKIIVLKKI